MMNERKLLIVDIVREEFSAPDDYHTNPSRSRNYVYPRKALCMLMRDYAAFSYMEVSRFFGKREHTTVRHAIDDGNLLLTQDESFKCSYERALERVKLSINDGRTTTVDAIDIHQCQ
jgi:chromosomal replication initiation ATPase DnaA